MVVTAAAADSAPLPGAAAIRRQPDRERRNREQWECGRDAGTEQAAGDGEAVKHTGQARAAANGSESAQRAAVGGERNQHRLRVVGMEDQAGTTGEQQRCSRRVVLAVEFAAGVIEARQCQRNPHAAGQAHGFVQ